MLAGRLNFLGQWFFGMIEEIKSIVTESLERVKENLGEEFQAPTIEITVPKNRDFGDYSTNVAMVLSNPLKRPPREIAELIVAGIPQGEPRLFKRVEVKGPGFVNFFINEQELSSRLIEIESLGDEFGLSQAGAGERVLVEYVSANPTGHLHMGHARNAAVGDTIANLLQSQGFSVAREFYINDSGRQIEMLGRSVLARYKQSFGLDAEIPLDGYFGEYIKELAEEVKSEEGGRLLDADQDLALKLCRDYAKRRLLEVIKTTLGSFGVRFDEWYSEEERITSSNAASGGASLVDVVKEKLAQKGATYEKDGALWFKASEFGGSQDWVLVKSDGSNTYFLNDIAYHYDKIARGFVRLINVWGADHHGHVARLKAALRALGYDDSILEVVLIQFVRLMREGHEVKMSKRAGSFVTMDEVLEEVGSDVARFFLLMRGQDSHLDFDLDLAKKESSENPVFYVQYANARIRSIFEKARNNGYSPSKGSLHLLTTPIEVEIIKKLLAYPGVLEESARLLAPHKVLFYLQDIASAFHVYYNKVRIIGEEPEITSARLFFVRCIQNVVRNGLGVLGVSVPERM